MRRGRRIKIGLLLTSVLALALAAARVHVSWDRFRVSQATGVAAPADRLVASDATLGWKHIPGSSSTALGTTHINRNGFRGGVDYDESGVPGARRIIALGDSFTFGYGLDDTETWPHLLEQRLDDTPVINMAANGYGIDQMLLWWRSDGRRFEADLVVLALVWYDFQRTSLSDFQGVPKPRFVRTENGLNLIPPRRAGEMRAPTFADYAAHLTRQRDTRDPDLPFALIDEIARELAERGTELLIVLLPIQSDLRSPNPLGTLLGSFAERRGLPFLDLTPRFREDLGAGFEAAFQANLHYTAATNALVADAISTRIR